MNTSTTTALPQPPHDLRVGLAGLGRFGKLHASVLGTLPGVRLAALCDTRPDELRALGQLYGVPATRQYLDYGRMIAEAALDAVFLVTPEPFHAAQALAAIARGLPVFTEKPLAITAADGVRVAEAARAAGVYLQVGFVLRFEIQHALLKERIAAGALGELVSVRVKRNVSRAWFPDYGDLAHPIFETGIHDLDLLLWYAASPVGSVYAVHRFLTGRRFPDACFALVQFASGAIGFLETAWCLPEGAPANVLTPTWSGSIDAALEVVGTEGTARLSLLEGGLQLWTTERVEQPGAGLWPALHGRTVGALREEDLHFVERVRTGSPSSIASIDDAVAGLRLAEAIVQSAESDREIRLSEA